MKFLHAPVAALLLFTSLGASASASDDLASRIAAAERAKASGDAEQVTAASRRLIAEALREMARLRVEQSSFSEAIEFDRQSLALEDAPGTRLELAMAEARAGRFDDAIQTAQALEAAGPGNIAADKVLATSLVQKGKYAEAAAPFARVAEAEPTVENQYAFTNCLLQTRRPEDKQHAQRIFASIEKQAGDSGSLHVLMGRAYRDADDMPAAVHEFETAIALDPRTPHAHYFLGLARLSLNEWKPTPEAEAEIKQEAELFPRDYLANYMYGFLLSGERNYAAAALYLKAAAAIDPKAPEPPLYLGLDAYAEDNKAEAEAMLRKAVELTGTDEARGNYQIRRAYVDLGRILSGEGKDTESEQFLAKARALQNKTMEQSQQSIASMAAGEGAGNSAAVMPLAKVAEVTASASAPLTPEQKAATAKQEQLLHATLSLAYNDLATSQAVRGEYAPALAAYQQAEHWDSTLEGLEKNLGICAFRAGDFAEATRALSLALQQQPQAASLRAMLGVAYFDTDQYAKAIDAFTPLGPAGMTDAETGYAWAASLTHMGDAKKATEVLAAFASEPRPNDVALLIGQLWTEIGDYPRAIATLDAALAADPYLHKAHYDEGLVYIHWERWADATREFHAELKLAPGDAEAEYHLGYVAMQQGKMDEAVAQFREVVAEHPDYANAQYQLGKILLDRGQVGDAVGYLEAAARLSPKSDYMHYQLQAAYRKADRAADADRELAIYKQLKATARTQAAEAVRSIQ